MSLLERVVTRLPRVAALLLALAIVFGLLVLGAEPFAVGLIPTPWDKLAHAAVFAVLAAVIGLASGLRGGRMFALALAGALLVGALDEWHQLYLPGRQAGLDDLAADAFGGLLGATLLAVYGKACEALCDKPHGNADRRRAP
ncbi:MAG: VanZ family protein [Candidatus Accumulibacter sp.]|nr:VanZ family protein [Accumulibacter sp.]